MPLMNVWTLKARIKKKKAADFHSFFLFFLLALSQFQVFWMHVISNTEQWQKNKREDQYQDIDCYANHDLMQWDLSGASSLPSHWFNCRDKASQGRTAAVRQHNPATVYCRADHMQRRNINDFLHFPKLLTAEQGWYLSTGPKTFERFTLMGTWSRTGYFKIKTK